MTKMMRCVVWFDKKTEDFVGKEELKKLSVEQIREVCEIPYSSEDPELYDVYDITQESSKKLVLHVSHQFNFSKYDYFLYGYEER